ncbi:glycosyltransferase family 4 protein [Methylobacterium sp. WL7]|uniref:glycosyltransferase family 4 protein n=1 Tax=Methylobacterium sp. WL7 TaxID=2603900 RepID=UPI00164F0349|nr:glycosyltransferase family 4 protein [Methylobacterium sp. WL7]
MTTADKTPTSTMTKAQAVNKERLYTFTPLPPSRNGIADYAYASISGLSEYYNITAFCNNFFAEPPKGVQLINEQFAFECLPQNAKVIHQIGNNPDHTFVLRAALRHPGIVVLHDPRILYLYQTAGISNQYIYDLMVSSNRFATRCPSAARGNGTGIQRVDHLMYDGLAEVLQTARAIVVHSNYSRQLICSHHGRELAEKIVVIPHFAYAPEKRSRAAARDILDLPQNAFIVVTAGFPHPRKRYEWLIEALDHLIQYNSRPVIWIQAGEMRNDEVPLRLALDRYPSVREILQVTGYLSENELDTYIAASDALVNLRFPSDGESSGSLARAFGAGVCCLISDTAAFRELPQDVAVKIPYIGAPEAISAALMELSTNSALRDTFGNCAAHYAETELSMDLYIARFRKVLEALDECQIEKRGGFGTSVTRIPFDHILAPRLLRDAIANKAEGVEIVLGPIPANQDAGPLLIALLPECMDAQHIRIRAATVERATGKAKYEIAFRLCWRPELRHKVGH